CVNWGPGQGRSDGFGHWATVGVKPMFTCEYGVPFTWDWAMYRGWYKGVREFGSAPAPWEFCNAEWNAQFLGDAAFQIGEPEKRNLRWEAKQFHALLNDEGKTWHRWDYPAQLGSREFTDQDLVIGRYITDNWRAFRTWGLSINSFWEHGRLWSLKPGVDKSRKNYDTDWENLQRPGFSPDFQDQRYERIDLAFERDDWIPSVAAEALIRNNSPLLGYIAGKDGAFTSKDHNFLPGETIEKQMVMVNNSREEVRAQCSYSSDDLPDWEDRALVSMYFPFETGEIKQLPMQYKLPNDLVPSTYTLRVNLRSHTEEKGFDMHGDTFTIHVMPPPEKIPAMNIALFDPKGETAKLLDELGVEYRLIHGIHDFSHGGTEAQSEENESTSLHVSVPLCEEFLVIGKDALDLSGDGFDLTGVPDGMKVIVFEQTAQTLEKRLGFRTAEYGLRQVFRRVADHPVLHNITDDNLRDWRGSSTLLPERLDYETNEQVFNGVPTVEWCGITVPRVWRCGNRGNVAGVLIEKPACGDFLPILDGGFSLQYSPLMEYRQGKGMILFCQMDVTGRTENDPAATHLVGNILRYVNDWKAEEKRKVAYTGKEEGVNYLKKIGASLAEFRDTGASIVAVPDDISPDEHVLALGSGSGFVISGELSSRFRKDGRVLMIGALPDSEYGMNVPFPEISTKEGEHISTYFEPFGMDSPLRGVGPADLHNRDPQDYPLVTGGTGVDVVGNGILAVLDDGRTVICGLAPWQFPADKQSFKRTFRRAAFTLSRLLGNMNVDMQTPLPNRFHGPVGQDEQRWLNGLYLDQPEEWDDPYRFFRW
ncbi:MAG: hypothetical protein FWH27_15110, partial [Planctomycetaceae bacterium]|nr:hypothetical protein [Planctomycetaceae bacterium]